MCLLEPNDYYPYSMPMKPTIKNKSQNNESCYDLKSTFLKNLYFLLWNEVCRVKRFVRLCGITWKSSDSSPQYSTTCKQTI